MSTEAIQVRWDSTPNPQTMRFSTGHAIANGAADFKSSQEAMLRSPLARKIFGFPWTDAVYVSRDFVTVTKQDWVDWETLAEPLAALIQEHLERAEPVLNEEPAANAIVTSADSGTDAGTGTEDERTIREILDREIRPAVALDGGDVQFDRYVDGIVYLHMRGSCAGCPSSSMTLKQGIESRLRNAVPGILDVVAV